MLLSRVLELIGRLCVVLGILTLLFITYQLWGTGILTAQAQGDLREDFEQFVNLADELNPNAGTAVPSSSNDSETNAEDERNRQADTLTKQAALSKLLWRPSGEPVARLAIPKIDLEWTVVSGVDTRDLQKGPGHYPETPLPGMPGNASVAGHRTSWGAPFKNIDKLDPGDLITVETIQGDFEYRVIAQDSGKGYFIVSPNRVDVLKQDFAKYPNRLTLTACHPKFSARQRIIVVAELISPASDFIPPPEFLNNPTVEPLEGADNTGGASVWPISPNLINRGKNPDIESKAAHEKHVGASVTSTPGAPSSTSPDWSPIQTLLTRQDFGNGLNGDPSAILPAVMWGLAASAIAFTATFIARRSNKLLSYAFGILPFALVTFVCFMHIDQALPSY